MALLLLALLLFFYLGLVGRAAFGLLGLRYGHVRTWLLAPALGLSVTGLLVMILNQAGLPIGDFAKPLFGITLLGAIAVLLRYKLTVPRALLPFGLIAGAALLMGGWPALMHGFNWIGYGNDDMTNYCLGAERFLRHGFYAIPTPADLEGGDYPALFWMLHVAGQIRFGSEHMIAYLAGFTGLAVIQAFTPVLLAFSLTQIAAVMGLALAGRRGTRVAVVTGLMLGTAPLWYGGTMYQLIAQVGGLGLLAVILALVGRTRFPQSLGARLRIAGVSALLLSALSIHYPEVMPFLVLGWGVFVVLVAGRQRRWPAGLFPTAGCALLLTFLFLRQNTVSTLLTLLGQAQDGMDAQSTIERVSLFPYFLMPAGPAFLFGFDVFVARYPEPWASVALIAGFVAGLAFLVIWLRSLRWPDPSAAILAAMLPVGALLFYSKNGFGLFKLCMFALPFMVVVAARFLEGRRARFLVMALYVVLIAVWLPGIWRYSLPATNLSENFSGELLNASVARGPLPDRPAWSATTSSPINKLLMLEAPAARPVFLSQLVGATLVGRAAEPYPPWVWEMMPGNATGETARRLAAHLQTKVYYRQSVLGLHFWDRSAADHPPEPEATLIVSQAELGAFNKFTPAPFIPSPGLFSYAPMSGLKDYLVFVQSVEGHHYYLGAPGHIAVYRPQPDIYRPEEHFFAIGRYLLFRVINPSETVRVRLAMTASILGLGRTDLPQAAKVRYGHDEATGLGLVGSGSANVFSPPLRPTHLNGAAYLVIDLGRPPIPLGLPARDLQGLYRRDLSLDTRLALGYCRDISLVSEEAYQARILPRGISSFPADLLSPNHTEYSGIYEDGWIARQAYVKLGPAMPGDRIEITGTYPLVPGATPSPLTLTLLLNGQVALSRAIAHGAFVLEAKLDQAVREVKVELQASQTSILPSPDDRPVSFLLQSIRLQSTP